MKVIRLKPITEPPTLMSELEKEIQRVIMREIYVKVLEILRMKPNTVKNADPGKVAGAMQADFYKISQAMHAGTLTWDDGMFSGQLDAGLTKALKSYGATWDRRLGVFRLSGDDLPADLSHLISVTSADYEARMKKVDDLLKGIKPEEISDKVAVTRLFDNAIKKTEKQFSDNVSKITLTPQMTAEEKNKLIDRWNEQAKHAIKGLVEEQVDKIRSRVKASVEVGTRYSNLVKGLKREYEISEGRAKLIAIQETKSLVNAYAQERYEDAGIREYYWVAVHGTPLHPVRPMHQALADESKKGKTYRFDDPPQISPDGRRGNPGDDFRCRCRCRPVIRFGGK